MFRVDAPSKLRSANKSNAASRIARLVSAPVGRDAAVVTTVTLSFDQEPGKFLDRTINGSNPRGLLKERS